MTITTEYTLWTKALIIQLLEKNEATLENRNTNNILHPLIKTRKLKPNGMKKEQVDCSDVQNTRVMIINLGNKTESVENLPNS